MIVRQRPGTAKGFVFITLEDETGFANAIVTPQRFAGHKRVIVASSALIIEGVVQNQEGVVSIKADRFSRARRSCGHRRHLARLSLRETPCWIQESEVSRGM